MCVTSGAITTVDNRMFKGGKVPAISVASCLITPVRLLDVKCEVAAEMWNHVWDVLDNLVDGRLYIRGCPISFQIFCSFLRARRNRCLETVGQIRKVDYSNVKGLTHTVRNRSLEDIDSGKPTSLGVIHRHARTTFFPTMSAHTSAHSLYKIY